MWEILDISIPAVVLFPLIAIGVVIWMCLQQNARSGDVRKAEFQRLRRLAMEEHERAERELEQEYMRHRPVDSPRMEYSPHRRPAPGNGYGNDRGDVGLGGWRDPHEGDARRRKQAEDEEHRRKQGDSAFNRRRLAEEEDDRRKQAAAHQEADFMRRKQAAADELRAEIEERKRREAEEEIRRRQTEEQDWQRRRADLEAQARREADEERRRLFEADEEERQRRWKQEEAQRLEAQRLEAQRLEAQKQEASNFSPRRVQSSGLTCVVCGKPTKTRRRCSRCKSMNYCSKECQVQHWTDGHKFECRPVDSNPSPRSSMDGDTRNFSDFNSPRSWYNCSTIHAIFLARCGCVPCFLFPWERRHIKSSLCCCWSNTLVVRWPVELGFRSLKVESMSHYPHAVVSETLLS